MAQPVSRLTDATFGVCIIDGPQAGVIASASTDVICNGLGVARQGDIAIAACGHFGVIATASTQTLANGQGVARVGDTGVGIYNFTIVQGSSDTFSG